VALALELASRTIGFNLGLGLENSGLEPIPTLNKTELPVLL